MHHRALRREARIGSAAHADVHRVGVHLREVPQGDPAAPLDRDGELELVDLVVGRHVPRRDHPAVDDQLDAAGLALGR